MLMSGRIISTIREPLNRQCLGTVLAPLGVSFSLQIEDQGLVEFDLSSWTHLIWIGLCYALELCHSFKSCALPPSHLFHAPFLRPIPTHSVASTIYWRENQKIAGPWEGNTMYYPIPVDIQAFVFHVSYNMCNNSFSQWTRKGRWQAHNACEKSICGWHPFTGNLASRDNDYHFESFPAGFLDPNPYHPSPKVTNILLDQISTPFFWIIWSVASYQFVLKPVTNSYNQDLPPCRQHSSTQLIIKILLKPLTGPDNPLLCHYFCYYYLKWVYDSEILPLETPQPALMED